METSVKSITLVAAILGISSASALYAGSTEGKCSQKADSGKVACSDKNEKMDCGTCTAKNVETKSEKECPGGVCSLSGKAESSEQKTDHRVTTLQLKSYIDSSSAILLDARSGKYDDGYRIPGAKSLNSESSEEEIASVIPNKESVIVTYCSNLQCPASQRLADHLTKLGYTQVKEYAEGIAGWREAGGQVEKANK